MSTRFPSCWTVGCKKFQSYSTISIFDKKGSARLPPLPPSMCGPDKWILNPADKWMMNDVKSPSPWLLAPPLTSVRLMVFILSGGKSLSFGQGGMGGRIGGYECTCVFMNVELMLLVPLHDSLPRIDQRKTHGVYPKRGEVSFLWSGGNGGKGRGAWMYMCAWLEYNCVWWMYAT